MNQQKRINALKRLQILDTDPEQAYDDIVLLASQLTKCSVGFISLVDGDRLWFKAKIGISQGELIRIGSFCDVAILNNQLLAITDAEQDERFKKNELVKAGIRFYAGVPLVMKNGEVVGNLSVLDHQSRTLSQIETDLLGVLARQVVGELEKRLTSFQLAELNRELIKTNETLLAANVALETSKAFALENETKYRNLIQLSPAGIFQTDAAGKFVFVSERWQKVAGLTMEEAIHSGWENAVHSEDKGRIFNEWTASNQESRPFKCEYRLRTPNGQITWVNAESYQLRDTHGKINGYLGALQDITSLKNSEEELRLAHAELEKGVEERTADVRSLSDSIPQLVWQIGPNGEPLYMSPKWTELTGVAIDKAQCEGTIHPDDIPHSKAAWINCLVSGKNYETEYRIKLKDGTYRWFLARAVRQFSPDGKTTKWFGTSTDIEIQKQAIEKAALAQQKLSRFLSSVPMILWATDANGIVTLSEGKGLASIGLKPGQTVGWDTLGAQKTDADSANNVRRALSGESFDAVIRYGDHIVETRYSPLLDLSGNPNGMVAISNDISERVKLEAALLETEKDARDAARKLKAVLHSAPIKLIEINRDGIVSYADGKYLSSLGLNKNELVGQSYLKLHQKDAAWLESVRRAFTGETVTTQLQNDVTRVLMTMTPFIETNDNVTSILALGVDMTESMRAENTIRTIESKFKKVCESKLFGMMFWDENGAVNDTNDTFLNMLGYNRNDLSLGLLSWKDLTPPEYMELDAKAVSETIAQGYCEPYEKEFIRKDGSRVAIIISGATLHGVPNTGGIALVIDVSAKKKAEKEKAESILNERAALHASKTKSQFLANMSHEIRTPINGVLGMVSLLLDTPLRPQQREYAEAAHASADSLLTVINDILDFSKIEAGKLDFENIDFDLYNLLHNVERAFVYEAQRKNLKLVFNRSQNVARFFKGDSGRLRQILNNLLSNAVKFTSKGQITVIVNQDSSQLRFEIKDTGAGIPANALDRMFKAFSQADSSTSRRFGGTGLGLSISKHLVEHMDGKIGVETKENEGSTFWFEINLPTADSPAYDTSLSVGTFSEELAGPFRILIAEDNAINQKIALRYLEKMGLRADAVANGFEVLDSLRAIPYDLILMDCQMPEMDGLEATRLIRSSTSLAQRNIPIIAMTANAITGDRENCLEAGMNDYVSKPVAPAVLFSVLKKWLTDSSLSKNESSPKLNDANDPLILDLEVIRNILQLDESDDGKFLAELINLYVSDVPRSIVKMTEAFGQLNFTMIRGESHQLKSSSANLGVSKMAHLTTEIEKAAIDADKLKVGQLLNEIENLFQEGATALQRILDRPAKDAALQRQLTFSNSEG